MENAGDLYVILKFYEKFVENDVTFCFWFRINENHGFCI